MEVTGQCGQALSGQVSQGSRADERPPVGRPDLSELYVWVSSASLVSVGRTITPPVQLSSLHQPSPPDSFWSFEFSQGSPAVPRLGH